MSAISYLKKLHCDTTGTANICLSIEVSTKLKWLEAGGGVGTQLS